jgi:hypothetical protein
MRISVRAVAVAASVLICGGVNGHAADRQNLIRFGAAYVAPTGELTTDGFFVEDVDPATRLEFMGDLVIEPTEAVGLWISYERRFGHLIGLDATLLGADHDVDGTLSGTISLIDNGNNEVLQQESFQATEDLADLQITPLMVGANFHVLRDGAVDLYLGPFLAYVFYGDLDFGFESIPIDDDVGFGAVVGVDVPLGKGGWVFSGAIRYLTTDAQPSESGPDSMALDVDPWIVQVGAGYRF